jgi:peptide/nickel transport system permease protein
MIPYILRRIITGFVMLFLYVSILFFVIQLALPGDYISHYALGLTNAESKAARETLGLDQPLLQRYVTWVAKILHGEFGVSFSAFGMGPPVKDIIYQTLPSTLLIFGIGTVLAFILGINLGRFSAWRKGGILPGTITLGGIAFYTAFPPWLAFLIIYFIAKRIGLPAFGISITSRIREPGFNQADIVWLMVISLCLIISGLLFLNYILRRFDKKRLPGWLVLLISVLAWFGTWYLMGIQKYSWEIFTAALTPIITFTLLSFGEILLIMRTSMADTIHEDYIWTARAKGLKEKTVRDHHAARNALLPVIGRMMTSIPLLLTGLVMIERIFALQGIGTTLFYAVGYQNVPLALGMLIVIGGLSLVVRIMLEIVQLALNPRVRTKNVYI